MREAWPKAIAAVIAPIALRAAEGPEAPAEVAALDPEHDRVADLIAGAIERSRAVVAVHPRGATSFVEVVLWISDERNPGLVDASECVVLSHSRLLRTIVLHEPGADGDRAAIYAPDDPQFCTARREDPDARRRILATGVRELAVEPEGRDEAGRSMLRIALTWAGDSADSGDEATRLVAARLRPADGR